MMPATAGTPEGSSHTSSAPASDNATPGDADMGNDIDDGFISDTSSVLSDPPDVIINPSKANAADSTEMDDADISDGQAMKGLQDQLDNAQKDIAAHLTEIKQLHEKNELLEEEIQKYARKQTSSGSHESSGATNSAKTEKALHKAIKRRDDLFRENTELRREKGEMETKVNGLNLEIEMLQGFDEEKPKFEQVLRERNTALAERDDLQRRFNNAQEEMRVERERQVNPEVIRNQVIHELRERFNTELKNTATTQAMDMFKDRFDTELRDAIANAEGNLRAQFDQEILKSNQLLQIEYTQELNRAIAEEQEKLRSQYTDELNKAKEELRQSAKQPSSEAKVPELNARASSQKAPVSPEEYNVVKNRQIATVDLTKEEFDAPAADESSGSTSAAEYGFGFGAYSGKKVARVLKTASTALDRPTDTRPKMHSAPPEDEDEQVAGSIGWNETNKSCWQRIWAPYTEEEDMEAERIGREREEMRSRLAAEEARRARDVEELAILKEATDIRRAALAKQEADEAALAKARRVKKLDATAKAQEEAQAIAKQERLSNMAKLVLVEAEALAVRKVNRKAWRAHARARKERAAEKAAQRAAELDAWERGVYDIELPGPLPAASYVEQLQQYVWNPLKAGVQTTVSAINGQINPSQPTCNVFSQGFAIIFLFYFLFWVFYGIMGTKIEMPPAPELVSDSVATPDNQMMWWIFGCTASILQSLSPCIGLLVLIGIFEADQRGWFK